MEMMEYATTRKDELVGWVRKFSLFPYPFVTACCGMEFMSVSSTLYDTDRFGAALPRFTPRQSDLLMVVGTVSAQAGTDPAQDRLRADVRTQVGHSLRRLRDERRLLPATTPLLPGIDKIIPVDLYMPGLPAAAGNGHRRHHEAAGQALRATRHPIMQPGFLRRETPSAAENLLERCYRPALESTQAGSRQAGMVQHRHAWCSQIERRESLVPMVGHAAASRTFTASTCSWTSRRSDWHRSSRPRFERRGTTSTRPRCYFSPRAPQDAWCEEDGPDGATRWSTLYGSARFHGARMRMKCTEFASSGNATICARMLLYEGFVGHPLAQGLPEAEASSRMVPYTGREAMSLPPLSTLPTPDPPGIHQDASRPDHVIVNIGPFAPRHARHDPDRGGDLDGERVVRTDVHCGYLHRGFEKEAESHTYHNAHPVHRPAELLLGDEQQLRLRGGTVEKLLGIETHAALRLAAHAAGRVQPHRRPPDLHRRQR